MIKIAENREQKFIEAAKQGNLDGMQLHWERGINEGKPLDINAVCSNENQYTAVHYNIRYAKGNTVVWLIEHGADLTQKTNATPLIVLSIKGAPPKSL